MYGSRLRHLIVDKHDIRIERTFLWTDSTTVLQWLHGAVKKQLVFEANRVAEVLECSVNDQWRHVEGNLIPADIGKNVKFVHDLVKRERRCWATNLTTVDSTENRRHRTSR